MKRIEGRESRVESRRRVLVFRNRQRTRTLDVPLLRRIVRTILERQFDANEYELGFHFVDARAMARVNEQFLKHEGSTDVITFDHGSSQHCLHGEVFISVPDAVKQAREFRTTWQSEIVRYLIHGLLHLRGYDDLRPAGRREMKREENRLVRLIKLMFPLRQRPGTKRGEQKSTKEMKPSFPSFASVHGNRKA